MKTSLAYGKTALDITIPDSASVTVVEPAFVPAAPDQVAAVADALRDPIGSPPLRDRVTPGRHGGGGVQRHHPSDAERTDRAGRTAAARGGGRPARQDHPFQLPPARTGRTRAKSWSACWARMSSPATGSCRTTRGHPGQHVAVGTTRSGNEILIQKDFTACSFKILTGFIEPHFFAGFSGGGKAIMPGHGASRHGYAEPQRPQHRRREGDLGGARRQPPARRGGGGGLVRAARLPGERRAEPGQGGDPGLLGRRRRGLPGGHGVRQEDRHGRGGLPVRHRDHLELRLAAGPQPLPGGQGNERGRADHPAGRRHHRGRGVPRRHPRPRLVRPAPARGEGRRRPAGPHPRTRLPDGRSVGGADPRPHREEGRRLRARGRPDAASRSPVPGSCPARPSTTGGVRCWRSTERTRRVCVLPEGPQTVPYCASRERRHEGARAEGIPPARRRGGAGAGRRPRRGADPREGLRHLRQRRARHGRVHRAPAPARDHGARGRGDHRGDRARRERLAAGDRVTFDSTIWCGACWHCRRGEINLCDDRRVLGVSCAEYRQNGAFAEFVAVPDPHPLPAARWPAVRGGGARGIPFHRGARGGARPDIPRRHGPRRRGRHDRPARDPGAEGARVRPGGRRRRSARTARARAEARRRCAHRHPDGGCTGRDEASDGRAGCGRRG